MIKIIKPIGEYNIGDIVQIITELDVEIIPTIKGKYKQLDYCYRVDLLITQGYAIYETRS